MRFEPFLKELKPLFKPNSSNPQSFLEPIISKLKNKIVTINDIEWCSYFEDYETNWNGTSSGIPIYCNGKLTRLENGDIICKKNVIIDIYYFCI